MLRQDACDKGVILALPLGQYPFMDTARQVAPITRNTCTQETQGLNTNRRLKENAKPSDKAINIKAYEWRTKRCWPVLRV